MEEVLKGLQGKPLTKKKFFDFLADINIEDLYGKKNNVIEPAAITEIITNPVTIEKKVEEIKCAACKKTFTAEGSLKRHYVRNPVFVNWISLPEKTESVQLTKGIHLIINDILEKAISVNNELQCKFCKTKFTNTGNHHKHFNTSTVCNQLAYQEFKKLFSNL